MHSVLFRSARPEVSVSLRDVSSSDLSAFFEHQRDPAANRMAAFTARDPGDRGAFFARWAGLLADTSIITRCIVWDGRVAGHILCFEQFGKPSVSYWLGREFWGRGIATRALGAFLAACADRPLYARAARDNLRSLRVLEKCGFALVGADADFSVARGERVEELILKLGT